MINIKELRRNHVFTLHKVNMDIVGQIPYEFCNDENATIGSIDEIKFTIPKYITDNFTFEKKIYPLFNEISEERVICVNSDICFTIKDIDLVEGVGKEIIARSKEVKLGKKDINIEDVGIQLFTSDIDNDILSLNNLLKEQTGWSLGNISNKVAYDIAADGTKVEKVRWQESVDSNWYDYLTKEIKEQFDCIVTFDTFNKKVNLIDYDSFGDNIQLYLSYDNYIKSLKETTSTQEIVTRLTVVGSEEMDIVGATCTGYPYLEDYSYFINNNEMSTSLRNQLLKYQEMLVIRDKQWKQLSETVLKKKEELKIKKSRWTWLISSINAKESILKTYETNNDTVNYAKTAAEITQLKDEEVVVKIAIEDMESEILTLQASIDNVNLLCKRETATDEGGNLIFNENTLEELKEFIYDDTYTNDCFIEVDDLVNAGKREISLRCKPTFSWSIDVSNFMSRVIDNGFRQHWKGDLALGDIIILYDKENNIEQSVYFVGYTKNHKEGTLQIELSNKKVKEDDKRTISDTLGDAERVSRAINKKKYLLINQKYNKFKYGKEG